MRVRSNAAPQARQRSATRIRPRSSVTRPAPMMSSLPHVGQFRGRSSPRPSLSRASAFAGGFRPDARPCRAAQQRRCIVLALGLAGSSGAMGCSQSEQRSLGSGSMGSRDSGRPRAGRRSSGRGASDRGDDERCHRHDALLGIGKHPSTRQQRPQSRRSAPTRTGRTLKRGPDARRRPTAAREAYLLYVERAAEGADDADGPFSASCLP